MQRFEDGFVVRRPRCRRKSNDCDSQHGVVSIPWLTRGLVYKRRRRARACGTVIPKPLQQLDTMDHVIGYDGGEKAVITCYCEHELPINSMVFADGTCFISPKQSLWGHSTGVPRVVAKATEVTAQHRFFGIAVGARDHNFVAVAVNGVATVVCGHDDLNDAFATDLLQIKRQGRTVRTNTVDGGFFETLALTSVQDSDSVVGGDVVGVLMAHGRNPADECRVLLLPGLAHLPPAPPRATAQAEDADASMECEGTTLQDFEKHEFDFKDGSTVANSVLSMTLQQLRNVSIAAEMGFKSDVAAFIEQVVDMAKANPDDFALVVQ